MVQSSKLSPWLVFADSADQESLAAGRNDPRLHMESMFSLLPRKQKTPTCQSGHCKFGTRLLLLLTPG